VNGGAQCLSRFRSGFFLQQLVDITQTALKFINSGISMLELRRKSFDAGIDVGHFLRGQGKFALSHGSVLLMKAFDQGLL